MSNALEIAQQLSRLGTDVFVVYRPEEDSFPTPKIKFYKSEAKHYVSDLDDFIGAEVEISVNIDEPLPFVIINEKPEKETSEVQLIEAPKEPCGEIPSVTKQNNHPKTLEGGDPMKGESCTKDDRFSCVFEACSRNYSSRSNLTQHIREWHYKWKNFACDICDKKFSRGSILRNHRNTHTEVKPFGCNICEKHFRTQINLKVHRLRYHGKNDNRCRSCNKKLPNKDELRFHELAHEGYQCFVCRTCNMRFILSFELDQHECPFADIDINTVINKYKKLPPRKQVGDRVCCRVCYKQLSRKYVKTHEDVYHYKLKLIKCHLCDKSFATIFYLKRHIQNVHNNDKKHICKLCQKTFVRKANLKRHIKVVHKEDVGAGNECATLNVKNNNNLQQG